MAYLSREFWKPDEERVGPAAGAPLASSASDPGAASVPGVASAGSAPVAQGGDPGAIRAMFEANKGQGAQLWSGIADSLSKRFAGAGSTISGAPVDSQQPTTYDLSLGNPFTKTPTTVTATEHYPANPTNIATRQAAFSGLDSSPLSGREGIQSYLQKNNPSSYSQGMSGMDAWLANSAANPSQVAALKGQYETLRGQAGEQPRGDIARPLDPQRDASAIAESSLTPWARYFRQSHGW